MRRDPPLASILPTPRQELFLKVLLLEGHEWQESWHQWSVGTQVDALDGGSYRLLPMLYRKLKRMGADYPQLSLLKGTYRKNWFRNHQLFDSATPAMESLHRSGIPIMLLKGAALTLRIYRDFGLRTMDDIDLLVPTPCIRNALAIMKRAGWRFNGGWLPERRDFLVFHHAFGLEDSKGNQIDLHRHALIHCMTEEADIDFWSSSEAVELDGIPCRTMNPADQLLHVLAHGAQRNRVSPLRWVADACWVLRRHPELDWRRLLEQTEKRQLAPPLRMTLNYLTGVMEAPVPADVIDRLRLMRVSHERRTFHELHNRPVNPVYCAKWFGEEFRRFRRGSGRTSLLRDLVGYGRVLQFRWSASSLWQLLFGILRRVLRRVSHWLLSWPAHKR